MEPDQSGRVQSWKPTPREDCPERCQGHYAPCEHRTGYTACPDCVRQRGIDGPIFCEGGTYSGQPDTPGRTYSPGTVVEAEVTVDGKTVRRLFFRTAYTPNPWVAEQDVRDRAYYDDADFRDVVVMYAPARVRSPEAVS